jgi:hypothetical protein
MRTFRFRIVPALALMAFASVLAPAAHAVATPNAEPQDLDVEILAQIARDRAKGNAQQSADKKAFADPTNSADGCGNIGIGNVFTGGQFAFLPREINVIVTGDIISANNRCR